MLRVALLPSSLTLLLIACGPVASIEDAGLELPADAGIEGSPDAGFDAGIDGGTDPCGEHGHTHGIHCDCDPGFTEEAGLCVPIAACEADDLFEPNDVVDHATRWTEQLAEATLALCPGNRDYFLVAAEKGVRLTVTLQFVHADGDLSLALWEPGKDPRYDGTVARSATSEDFERISHTTRKSGDFLIAVYGASPAAQGAYGLDVTLDSVP